MKNLILIGAGGHAKSCIDVIELENKFKIIGLIDFKEKVGNSVLGYPIIDSDENLRNLINKDTYFLITLGQIKSPSKRIELFEHLKKFNAKLATIVSPLAHVSKYAKVGEGSIVMHGAIINAAANVGKNCIINSKSLIEHDAIVENHCHISTGAIVNGTAIIGEKSFIGSNSTVVHGVKVLANSFVKAGSLVK